MVASFNSRSRPEKSPSLPDKVSAIHHALREAKIPHAIGGALALAYYAEPRATIDVDINVFVSTERWPEICETLAPLGINVEVEVKDLNRDGQVRLWWDRNPVDLFFSYDPFHDAMRRDARKVPFNDETIPILSPEHLAVCKAMFDRPKDWLDIPQVLVGVEGFDASEVRRWLDATVGSNDLRCVHFDELAYELLGR